MSELPKPRIKPVRWPVLLIWIVPILAAVAAVVYYVEYRDQNAREIVIRFDDASGLKAGQTPVNHLGVEIGTVWELELSPDHSAVLVHVQLHKPALDFARQGTIFWIERAEISAANISGLTTVVSGPYIDTIPGNGPPATQFKGLKTKPIVQGPGVKIVLHTDQLQHVQRDSGIYFRGVQVGVVQSTRLNSDASGVDIHLFIWQRYASLVRADSQFWIEKGIDFSGGLFSGIKLNVESVRALLSGGITFATPSDKAPQAHDGSEFPLNQEPKSEWRSWPTRIPLPADQEEEQDMQETPATLPSAVKQIAK